MVIDTAKLLDDHNIEYVMHGPNVARGHLNVRCPFCGNADSSHHMGIRLDFSAWGCWRNRQHRGYAPHRLIMALLNCTYAYAAQLAGYNQSTPLQTTVFDLLVTDPNTFFNQGNATKNEEPIRPLRIPKDHHPLDYTAKGDRFLRYLQNRGYNPDLLVGDEEYNLHYAVSGGWRNRIIFPIYMGGKLVSWTGRSIYKTTTIRYKTLSTDIEKAMRAGSQPALTPITNCVMNFSAIKNSNAHTLFITEGPFDWLNVDLHIRDLGARATCLFTSTVSPTQADYLSMLDNIKQFVILLDEGAEIQAIQAAADLVHLHPTYTIVEGDPGSMTRDQIRRLVNET